MKQITIRGSHDYILFQSITKLFVAFMIHYLYIKGKLSYNDNIIKYFPNYKYIDITILDILQHKSGLYNDWNTEFQTSKTHRKYAFNLEITLPVGVFNYNNFAYDILCEVIEKVSGQRVDKLIGQLFFNKYNIKYFWYSQGKPYGGFGLGIATKDVYKLSNLLDFLKSIKYQHMFEHDLLGDFIGHSGSGGQFLYFDKDFTKFIFIANTGNEPFQYEFDLEYVKSQLELFT